MPSTEGETNIEPAGGTTASHPVRRRGRRGRGGRGRRGGRGVQPRQLDGVTPAPQAEAPHEIAEPSVPPSGFASPPRKESALPSSVPPIRKAIDEVNQIIVSLKTVLTEMEEVLELLEMAEVQKDVDEREIAALQQALKRLQRGSEGRRGFDVGREPREPQSQPQ